MTPEERKRIAKTKRHNQMNKYVGYRLGQALQKYRHEKKLSNEELAEAVGCHPQTLSKYCGDNNDMRLDSFLKVVKTCDLSISSLLKGTEFEGLQGL